MLFLLVTLELISISFCPTFHVTKFQLNTFFWQFHSLSSWWIHNRVFQKLLKLMNQRPVTDLHWGLEGAEPSLIRHPWLRLEKLEENFDKERKLCCDRALLI